MSDADSVATESSVGEEERLRRLFFLCDENEDGFIDSSDLFAVCRELDMESALNEIMAGIGTDEHGMISLDEFVRRGLEVKNAISFPDSYDQKYVQNPSGTETKTKYPNGDIPSLQKSREEMAISGVKVENWKNSSNGHQGEFDSQRLSRVSLNSINGHHNASKNSDNRGIRYQQLQEEFAMVPPNNVAAPGNNYVDLANTLHLAALASLKQEIVDLKLKLSSLSAEKDALERKLAKSQADSQALAASYESKLENQAARYEERITELTGVIFEINKQFDRVQGNTIEEEDEEEEEEEEYSVQEESVGSADSVQGGNTTDDQDPYTASLDALENSADLSVELARVVQHLEQAAKSKPAPQKPSSSATQLPPVNSDQIQIEEIERRTMLACQELEMLQKHPYRSKKTQRPPSTIIDSESLAQVSVLESQLTAMKARVSELQASLDQSKSENCNLTSLLSLAAADKQRLSNKVTQLEQQLKTHSAAAGHMPAAAAAGGLTPSHPNLAGSHPPGSPGAFSSFTLPKPAAGAANGALPGRPPLHRSAWSSPGGHDLVNVSCSSLPGSASSSLPPPIPPPRGASVDMSRQSSMQSPLGQQQQQKPSVAEKLLQSFKECSSVEEAIAQIQASTDERVAELELQLEKQVSRGARLESEADVMQLTLGETKATAERLSMLCGQYESNNTALRMAMEYADHCIQALESLVALADADQGIISASYTAAGLCGALGDGVSEGGGGGGDQQVSDILHQVHDSRRSAESLAKSILSHMDSTYGSINQSHNNSSQPWEDLSSHSRTSTTSSTNSITSTDSDWSKLDQSRLLSYIRQLKADRAAIRLTVVELESVYVEPPAAALDDEQGHKQDLENAVLVQELMSLKEEKAELRAQLYLVEKEKRQLELRQSSHEAQHNAYRLHIDFLKQELAHLKHSESREAGAAGGGRERLRDETGSQHSSLSGSTPLSTHKELPTTSLSGGAAAAGAEPPPIITLEELRATTDLSVLTSELSSLDVGSSRDQRYRTRVQQLVHAIETLSTTSQQRHLQSAEFINDLKRANSALITAYEKAKKKHSTRLKKLESQMKAMCDRHENTVRMLKQRISLLEEGETRRLPPNETSL